MSSRRLSLAVGVAAALFIAAVVFATTRSGDDGGSPTSDAGRAGSEGHQEGSNIYVVDVATRAVTKLTQSHGERLVQAPAWSAADRVAFTEADCDECQSRLYVIGSDGLGKRNIRTRVSHVFQPTWAPDGRRIAVVRLGDGLYSVDVQDGRARRLTSGESDEAPAWSPDGSSIVFHKQVRGTNWDLYEVSSSGRKLERLTRDPLQQTNPTWSPGGARLAFAEQQRNGNWAIYTMKVRGAPDRARLTDSERSSQEPAWSPDGKKIAYIDQTDGGASIAVVAADGEGEPARLTGRAYSASRPAWSPDGSKIAFSAREAS